MPGSRLCLTVQQSLVTHWPQEPLLTGSAVAPFHSAHRSTTVVTPAATWNAGGPSSVRNFLCLLATRFALKCQELGLGWSRMKIVTEKVMAAASKCFYLLAAQRPRHRDKGGPGCLPGTNPPF